LCYLGHALSSYFPGFERGKNSTILTGETELGLKGDTEADRYKGERSVSSVALTTCAGDT